MAGVTTRNNKTPPVKTMLLSLRIVNISVNISSIVWREVYYFKSTAFVATLLLSALFAVDDNEW